MGLFSKPLRLGLILDTTQAMLTPAQDGSGQLSTAKDKNLKTAEGSTTHNVQTSKLLSHN
jgi:hypothetical protein